MGRDRKVWCTFTVNEKEKFMLDTLCIERRMTRSNLMRHLVMEEYFRDWKRRDEEAESEEVRPNWKVRNHRGEGQADRIHYSFRCDETYRSDLEQLALFYDLPMTEVIKRLISDRVKELGAGLDLKRYLAEENSSESGKKKDAS